MERTKLLSAGVVRWRNTSVSILRLHLLDLSSSHRGDLGRLGNYMTWPRVIRESSDGLRRTIYKFSYFMSELEIHLDDVVEEERPATHQHNWFGKTTYQRAFRLSQAIEVPEDVVNEALASIRSVIIFRNDSVGRHGDEEAVEPRRAHDG